MFPSFYRFVCPRKAKMYTNLSRELLGSIIRKDIHVMFRHVCLVAERKPGEQNPPPFYPHFSILSQMLLYNGFKYENGLSFY